MNTRDKRKAALKEDFKYLLKELWDAEEEGPFFKIFTREYEKGIQKVLRHSKADLQDLTHRDDDRTVY